MKRANGTGSVYREKTRNLRKPWIASVTLTDADGFRSRKRLGAFETRKAAQAALDAYNTDPVNLEYARATFSEIFDEWYREYSHIGTSSTLKNYRAGFNACKAIHDRVFVDLRTSDLQRCLDESGKHAPTQETMRKAMSNIYKYALKNDIVKKDYSQFLTISKRAENPNKRPHVPYTDAEIAALWADASDDIAAFQLILIYSGCRISELIELDPADIDLDAQCFTIRQAKTRAGIRTVPIADKTLPLWQRLAAADRKALLIGASGAPIKYQQIRVLWDEFNSRRGLKHYPHDTRHTTVTKLSDAGVPSAVIKKIVGHKDGDVTGDVYDHKTAAQLLEAINRI